VLTVAPEILEPQALLLLGPKAPESERRAVVVMVRAAPMRAATTRANAQAVRVSDV